MTTYLQTVTIEFPTSEKVFFGIELAPVCPPSFKPEEDSPFIVMKNKEDTVTIWWKNGIIVKGYKDGLTKTWYPKPELGSALYYSLNPANKGVYFEFHKDKSVTSTVDHQNYYWSPEQKGVPEDGMQVFGYTYDENEYEDEEVEKFCQDGSF